MFQGSNYHHKIQSVNYNLKTLFGFKLLDDLHELINILMLNVPEIQKLETAERRMNNLEFNNTITEPGFVTFPQLVELFVTD